MKKQIAIISVGIFFAILLFAFNPQARAQSAPEKQIEQAEAAYAEKSWAQAERLYAQISTEGLKPEEAEWIQFRKIASRLFNLLSNEDRDNKELENARAALRKLIEPPSPDAPTPPKNNFWAEINECLGDSYLVQNIWLPYDQYQQAWVYYLAALDYWAGSTELERAQDKYIQIVWKYLSFNPGSGVPYFVRNQGVVPENILQNAIKIARTRGEEARIRILLATSYRNRSFEPDTHFLTNQEYQKALESEKTTPWYDMALFEYGEWLENMGKLVWISEGRYTYKPDYEKALQVYKKLLQSFTKEESPYYEQAQNAIKRITETTLNVYVNYFFLPGSEIEFSLVYRNTEKMDLALYPIDLNRDCALPYKKHLRLHTFVEQIQTSGKTPFYQTSLTGTAPGDHTEVHTNITLQTDLPKGAYLLEAAGGNRTTRDLLLVTDTGIIFKNSPHGEDLAFVCNALTGEPIADAQIKLTLQSKKDNEWIPYSTSAQTDSQGLAKLDIPVSDNNYFYGVLSAVKGDQSAILFPMLQRASLNEGSRLSFYTFTDRPAYRPGEKVEWKLIVRAHSADQMTTPAGTRLTYRISDPKGNKVKEETLQLNDFGSAAASLEVTPEMTLGEYSLLFLQENTDKVIGSAQLFRLEEYKLPEFKVTVSTDSADSDSPKSYRVGDQVQATIKAEFFFGGPVANADVEVEVRQKEYHHSWPKKREYPWLYEAMDQSFNYNWRYNPGEVVKTETLKTDASGEAKIVIDTPRQATTDLEYVIEARVTDASRRQIQSQGSVKVTRQSYYAKLEPQKNIFFPGDTAEILVQTQDANGNPQKIEGRIEVKRKLWIEKWLNPSGKLVEGDELENLKTQLGRGNFPPAQEPGQKPWHIHTQGYRFENILSEKISTAEDGKAKLRFKIEKAGCYQVSWASDDFLLLANGEKIPWMPVKTETLLWSADKNTRTVGIRNQGITLVLDQDTARLGRTMPILVQTDIPGRHALFTVEADRILYTEVIHITGDAKLIELPITDAYTPNVWLSAAMMADSQLFQNETQIIVPPEKNYIQVQVTPDVQSQKPQDTAKVKIRTLDGDGNPLSTEVALGVTDESVYSIQQEYAPDPRKFFFGELRYKAVRTDHSLWRPLTKLLHKEEKSKDASTVEGEEMLYSEEAVFDVAAKPEEYFAKATAKAGVSLGGEKGMAMGGRAMPAAAPPMSRGRTAWNMNSFGLEMAESDQALSMKEDAGALIDETQVRVRTDFRSTILWLPLIQTDAQGNAEAEIHYPDNLTQWRITARAHSRTNQFGIERAEVKVRQPLMARLQAPRFFTSKDKVTLSALLNNNSEEDLTLTASLSTDSSDILKILDNPEISVQIPAHGEKRVDWNVSALTPGEVKIKVMARSELYADAMEKTYPVYEHGIEKWISRSGKLSKGQALISVNLPKERRSTSMEIQLTPSLAATMLDALPYLFDYPYGCTEQTMSRFLPAVIVARTLGELGLKPEEIETRLFGGRDPNIQAPKAGDRKPLSQLDEITQKSLSVLYESQQGDGGWGWWKDSSSDAYMTAYVLWGLALAQSAGIDIQSAPMEKAVQWLDENLVKYRDQLDSQAWMLHALSTATASEKNQPEHRLTAFNNLYENRERLNPYTRALLTLSALNLGFTDKAAVLVRNLENGVIRDNTPDQTLLFRQSDTDQPSALDLTTAHWGGSRFGWRWSDGDVESTAFILAALVRAEPKNELIQPAANWLIKNRRGTQWNNTRDTAITLLALTDFIKVSRENISEIEYALDVNGSPVDSRKLSLSELLTGKCNLWVDPALLHDGNNEIKLTRIAGDAPLYFSVNTKYFSLEDPIPAAGNEIFVRRQYYRLEKIPTLLKGPSIRKTLLKQGDMVRSGDRIEVVLTLDAKNNYEYLLFEDMKPAGFESEQLKSGAPLFARELSTLGIKKRAATTLETESGLKDNSAQPIVPLWRRNLPSPVSNDEDYTGRTQWVYQEQRDRKIASFLDQLPQGLWELRYECRAEIPGQFHALPVMGGAMYVPELRCNSDESHIVIEDQE